MMSKLASVRLVAASIALSCASNISAATTVDFQGLGTSSSLISAGGSLTTQGYTFSLSPNGSFIAFNYSNNPSTFLSNGTTTLFLANYGSVTMQQAAPTAGGFTLESFDLGGSWSDASRWASGLNITGNLVGGGQVTTYVALPTTFSFENVTLADFVGLSSVVFSPVVNANQISYDYEFQLDNLVVETAAVPEPGTWAMMLLGFGGVGLAMRHRNVRSRLQLA